MGVRKIYWTWLKNRMNDNCFMRHSMNKRLVFKGDFKAEAVVMTNEMREQPVSKGILYECFEVDGVKYMCVSDSKEEVHSIIAVVNTNRDIQGVGILNYRIERKNGNIALRYYFVTNEYRRRGIGGNMIKAMLRAEYDLLMWGANLYVHADAEYRENTDALSQKELENHYTKYGMILCDNCNEGAYENIRPKKSDRRNLLEYMRMALEI